MKKFSLALLISAQALSAASALAADATAPKWTVGVSQCNLGEPWRVQMNADLARAGQAHPELKLVFKDAQNDALRQRAQVEEFVAQKVDLLIISPKEAAPLTPAVADAYKKGIPVIVLDRKVLGQDFTTFIGADNRRIGDAAGRWIVDHLKGHGKIVELKGLMTSTPGQDRDRGFRDGVRAELARVNAAPTDLPIVFEADMKWLEPEARKEMESALATQPKIDLVYAHNDPAAHGAYLAARAAGREKSMVFVGVDGLPQEGQAYVRQGILAASFEYPTGGREAIEAGMKILGGGTVPKEIALRSRVFTPANVNTGGEWLQ
jgi:ribose transport system substrate-binding protein